VTTTPRRLVMAERREEDAADSSLRPKALHIISACPKKGSTDAPNLLLRKAGK
jgi:hypothetical protein